MDHVANVPYFEIRPDWVCEVLSPSTEKTDRAIKLPIYAREGVGHAWFVNPLLHTLEVLRLEAGRALRCHRARAVGAVGRRSSLRSRSPWSSNQSA